MAHQGWSNSVDHHDETYVAGRWTRVTGEQRLGVVDPALGDRVATVRESSEADVDHAVEAARAALPVLAAMPVVERAGLLDRLADELDRLAITLAETVTTEIGTPARHCERRQIAPAVETARRTARALREVPFGEDRGRHRTHRRPAGVVAVITPWSDPVGEALATLAPALAAGCPVVVKPSERTPLDAFVLARAVEAAGLPAGSFGLALGTGPQVGEALVAHPGIDLISFTGTRRVGKRVAHLAARTMKRVRLDLGGKSPAVVLDDGDLEAAVRETVASVMLNSGQTCEALPRLLVPFERLAEAEALIAKAMSTYAVGPPRDPATDVGPLANDNQFHQVTSQLERASLDGARPIWEHATPLPDRGYYVHPAAFVVTEPRTELAQQEVFGPVLTVLPYVDVADAVGLAGATACGRRASVWSADEERALRVALSLDARTVDVNDVPVPEQPGQEQSVEDRAVEELPPAGWNHRSHEERERSVHEILQFTEATTVRFVRSAEL